MTRSGRAAAKAPRGAFRAVLLAAACSVAAACAAVAPASGPPAYGDGRGNSSN